MRSWFLVVAAGALLLGGCRRDAPDTEFADPDSPQELVNAVAGLIPRIERLSGLDRVGTIRMRWQTPEAARAYVEQRLEQEMPPAKLDAMRRAYVALGLLPDTLDLHALLLDLYIEQVLGYYDPRAGTLYVVRRPDLDELRPVLIHELVHALQDQHADLDALVAQERGNDRQTAAHAALEGHAMVVMFAVLAEQAMRRQVDPTSLPNPAGELGMAGEDGDFPVMGRAPRIIRETLLFPYLHGADFVHQLWSSMRGMERYPAPLDTLLPQSTAQVLRPVERFIRERMEPVELRFAEAPAGWRELYEDSFGQLETGIFLEEHGGANARAAATGWLGDRYILVEPAAAGGAGPDVLHWVSVWEAAADADRFARAAAEVSARRTGRSVQVQRFDIQGHAGVWITDAAAGVAAATAPRPDVAVVEATDAVAARGAMRR